MKSHVAQYIDHHRLFTAEDKVLVALSGGADSVALLRLLLHLGYTCEAAHCNFHLRGAESDRDEEFVRSLCREQEVPLHIVHFDTEKEAKERHISIEMAARELRYGWFEEVREKCGAAVIAVAHHRDDSVETFLLNLIRGTGINGLRGIQPRNGKIARPLLCLDRKEITDYLDSLGQSYVTDSTNLQDEYTRNKIRLNLLPMMQEINPAVKESILKTAEHLEDAASIYKRGIEEAKKRILTPEGIRIHTLLQETAPETVLFEILYPLGFNAAQVKDIYRALSGQPGKVFASTCWRVVKDRELLLIEPLQEATKPNLTMKEYEYTPDFVIPRDRNTACFDADKLRHSLSLRLWQQGDTFVPFGMKGRKKVSDYLTDRKFSLLRKERQWVLCCGDDIIWLVGERADNRFRIDEGTKKALIVVINDLFMS
ncbi:tRNA lysidine(34) synthetase TilS [Bacteroides sp.]|uniref:tRNA lysidine(34) synthetase TilS n=1 Tax=Bacteroides sp. TaxID=29523 RepID=UPI003AB6D318